MKFQINTSFKLTGDQPKVVNTLSNAILQGEKNCVLKGVTGSGKTFCMANIIQKVNKPTIVISHNKTLAAQLYSEFKELFPNNAVEYFVSHYKHFQPECYLPGSDKYIEKETVVNDEIERMRQKCVQSLLTRNDVIVVASVSALFGLGNPKTFYESKLTLRKNQSINRDDILINLIKKQYERNDLNFTTGTFRVKGDVIDIMLSIDTDVFYRIEMFGDEIEKIIKIDNLSLNVIDEIDELNIFNISSYMVTDDKIESLCKSIETEMYEVYNDFLKNGEELYAQRILERTMFDIEMIKEIGYCKGLESYQRYLTDRTPGSPPYTLLDFFTNDYLMFIDESHATIPQVKSIDNQNGSIKQNLINYGFRLPSCIDNRPLTFNEFEQKQNQVIYVSATPSDYELMRSNIVCEQIIRPTGLLDPSIEVRPTLGQIDDIYGEINKTISHGGKVLITVITKKMAEDVSKYLIDMGINSCYLHSDIQTIDRIDILNDLQQDKYDVLIGCNLLREGLSISNCELVIILDADKEGFLRNTTSLLQTIGRAARNVNGRAILYADTITKSMQLAIDETNRHRHIQIEYNKKHGIVPKTTETKIIKNIVGIKNELKSEVLMDVDKNNINKTIKLYFKLMEVASNNLDFEAAIKYRDLIKELELLKENQYVNN